MIVTIVALASGVGKPYGDPLASAEVFFSR